MAELKAQGVAILGPPIFEDNRSRLDLMVAGPLPPMPQAELARAGLGAPQPFIERHRAQRDGTAIQNHRCAVCQSSPGYADRVGQATQ